MKTGTDILRLAQIALDGFDSVDLSTSARRAYRISRLMGDGEQSWLFRADLRPNGGSGSLRIAEISELFKDKPYEEVRVQNDKLREMWILERSPNISDQLASSMSIAKDSVIVGSIDELETHLRRLESDALEQDLVNRSLLFMRADLNREILQRITARTFGYLCAVETAQSMFAASNEIFENHRQRVDLHLQEVASEVLEKFNSAFQRIREGDSEARSQALTSCRRILKSIADVVCPATDESATDGQGNSHKLTDDNYINRIINFLDSQVSEMRFSQSLHATVDDLGKRIDSLYDLSSKGVHARVTSEEVEWCAIQMYLVAGEILYMHDPKSGKDSKD